MSEQESSSECSHCGCYPDGYLCCWCDELVASDHDEMPPGLSRESNQPSTERGTT